MGPIPKAGGGWVAQAPSVTPPPPPHNLDCGLAHQKKRIENIPSTLLPPQATNAPMLLSHMQGEVITSSTSASCRPPTCVPAGWHLLPLPSRSRVSTCGLPASQPAECRSCSTPEVAISTSRLLGHTDGVQVRLLRPILSPAR